MPMGDELASTSLNFTQKSLEISVELIKMLAPLVKKLWDKAFDSQHLQVGKVSQAQLFVEAGKAKSAILSNDNFLSKDADTIVEKAKKYGIPVSVVGDGEKVTLSYLERDKAVVNQILQETMRERMKTAPQDVKHFTVEECNLSAIKAEFEKNGIECCFARSANGKIFCQYPAECVEQVAIIKSDYKNVCMGIETNFGITPNADETERQLEIKSQIAELENAMENPEMRSKFYEEKAADTKIEYPVYSDKNMERVFEQMPEAKKVAGKAFWESQGYSLNDNAKGIDIIAPQMDNDGKPVLDENGKQMFTSITVYDISETNAFEKSVGIEIDKLQHEYNVEKISAFDLSNNKKVILSDKLSEKNIEITVDDKLRKSDVSKILCEEFGYSEVQANIAANKLCQDLNLDPQKFFIKTEQMDALKMLKTNIRYESDSILLRDTTFTAVNFVDGEHTHISITNGDKATALTPATMSREEMKNICISELEMTEEQANEAVEKSVKIDMQINSKLRETTIFRNTGEAQTVEIDRTSNNSFSVRLGSTKRDYSLNDEKLAAKISKDFGITEGKAKTFIDKAQKQSAFQNNVARAAKSAKDKASAAAKNLKENIGKHKGAKL